MLPSMGRLLRVIVSRNDAGFGASWYLDDINVTDPDGQQFFFPCFDWVAAGKAYDLQHSLLPAVSYSIAVTTATTRGAGTDSSVFCTLIGSAGLESNEMSLDKSNHFNLFERGQIDVFVVRCRDLGQLTKFKQVTTHRCCTALTCTRNIAAHWKACWIMLSFFFRPNIAEPW